MTSIKYLAFTSIPNVFSLPREMFSRIFIGTKLVAYI
jgi:hypothetical protein